MKIKQLFMRLASCLSTLSLHIGVGSVSMACWWWFAQPKVPQGMDKFIDSSK